jgi:hypothetical protein
MTPLNKDGKQVIENLLAECPHISPIQETDKDLFHEFFLDEVSSLPVGEGYGYSWAYITQMAHGRAYGYPLGLKYFNAKEHALIPLSYFPRPASNGATHHFHIVRPMGNWCKDSFFRLCELLFKLSQTTVYVKKLVDEEEANLLKEEGFVLAEHHPWHQQAFMEDDTRGEVIVDINNTLSYLTRPEDNELKRKYRGFLRKFPVIRWERYDSDDQALRTDSESVVRQFMEYPQVKALGLSRFDDFSNMIHFPPRGVNGREFFSSILYVSDHPAGFYIAERLGGRPVAGIYANIALRNEFRYSSEYLLLELLQVLQSAGIATANLGGSETQGLHSFKLKFRRSRGTVKEMRWVVFTQNNTQGP